MPRQQQKGSVSISISNASFTSSSMTVRPCNICNISSIHSFGVCCRLVEFLLNLMVKNCAPIVRLYAESAIFVNFYP